MRSRTPLLAACATTALLLSACQKAEDSASVSASDAAVEAADAAAVPGIGGAVAPGVAFRFDYAFTLPAKAISTVQQEHAAACEKLGSGRCRVTGMSYRQPDADTVEARMDFLLAPDIAHRFGSEGVAAVERAEGKLANASVEGENAGDQIRLSQQNSAGIEAEVKRIEERLAAGGLSKGERVELQQQIARLREQLRGEVTVRREKEKAIATTPVSFTYASEGLLGSSNAFGKAAGASWSSASALLALLTVGLGYALPWLLLIGLIVALLRSARLRRLLRNPVPAEPVRSE